MTEGLRVLKQIEEAGTNEEEQDVRSDAGFLDAEIEEKLGKEAEATFRRIAAGDPPIGALLDQWQDDIKEKVTRQTAHQHLSAVNLFLEHVPYASYVSDMNRRAAGAFTTWLSTQSMLAPKSQSRIISSVSSFWRWLERKGYSRGSNPWSGQTEGLKKATDRSKRESGGRERPYAPRELVKLLNADPASVLGGRSRGQRYGQGLHDMLRLGLLTACRANELASLRVRDVLAEDKAIHIPYGKTEAAERIIPLHPIIWPILDRRVKNTLDQGAAAPGDKGDALLFPEFPPGGPDRKRWWAAGQRFGEFRRKVLGLTPGTSEDNATDFHSLRRSFATHLERAQAIDPIVTPSMIAELMGHKKVA